MLGDAVSCDCILVVSSYQSSSAILYMLELFNLKVTVIYRKDYSDQDKMTQMHAPVSYALLNDQDSARSCQQYLTHGRLMSTQSLFALGMKNFIEYNTKVLCIAFNSNSPMSSSFLSQYIFLGEMVDFITIFHHCS